MRKIRSLIGAVEEFSKAPDAVTLVRIVSCLLKHDCLFQNMILSRMGAGISNAFVNYNIVTTPITSVQHERALDSCVEALETLIPSFTAPAHIYR
jgi:hypothetical protein